MSFLNTNITPINIDTFNSAAAVKARSKADAYTQSKNWQRVGDIGGSGLAGFGSALGDQFKIDAGAFAQQQQQNASNFGNIMNLAGGIGGFAAQGGFNNFGKTIGVDRRSPGMGIPGSVAPGGGEYYGPAF